MKYSNILKFAIAALLPALTGCSDSVIQSLVSPYDEDDSDKIHVTFSLDFDDAVSSGTVSRATDDEGDETSTDDTDANQSEFAKQIKEYNLTYEKETVQYFEPDENTPIYIIEFDENNLLSATYTCKFRKKEAVAVDDKVSCSGYHYYFNVTLNKSDKKRYFHIIANHNIENIADLPFATESDIFNSDIMVASNNVYWRRIELDKVDDDVIDNLKGLKLIRNFARVMLDFSVLPTATTIGDSQSYGSDYFKKVEWCMMNIPTQSFVAPYMKGQQFATYLSSSVGGSDHDNSAPYTYNELYEEGYRCHVPRTQNNADTFYKRTTNEAADQTGETIDTSVLYDDTVWRQWYEPLYVFENEGSSDSKYFMRTTFLIRATTNDGKQWYYRLNLVDATRNFEQLYLMRNVTYKVQIQSITDAGFDTASEAYTKAASNNFSGSTSTSTFTNVSVNNASLRVEYMKKYIFSSADFTMKYRYVPDVTNLSESGAYQSENGSVKVTSPETYDSSTQAEPAFVGTVDDGFAINAYKVATADISGSNYRQITFSPNTPLKGGSSVTSKVRVQVNDADKTQNNVLYRDVTFVLRNRYKLSNIAITKDGTNTYTLTVRVPNNLPQQIFPLDFTFETYPPCTYPDATRSIMRVISTDESLFAAGTKDSFHFHRAVTYKAYSANYDPTDSQTFVENKDEGYKEITFYFHFLPENLPTDDTDYVFFAVYEPNLSPNPDGDDELDAARPSPLFASFKYEINSDNTDVTLTPYAQYTSEEVARTAWYDLKALKTSQSSDNSSSAARRRSAPTRTSSKEFDPVVGAKNPQRIARLRSLTPALP
jgi:hypothetical protein